MWPWTRREPTNDDLKTRVDALERQFKSLQLEWVELSDKILHRLQRQAKRDRDAAATTATAPEAPGATNGGGGAADASPQAARAAHKLELYRRAGRVRGQVLRPDAG
jgi:hypothetical protein